jgi:site-specific DNA recombinase
MGRRTIGYVRVSSAGQAEKGMGLAAQRAKIEAYAAEQGWDLLEIVEEVKSGAVRDGELFSHAHRPRLSGLLERAEAGGFDVLVVAKLDRLSRDFATAVFLERLLRRHGVQVVSATEANGDGAHAEFVRGIYAQVAQLERAMIRERLVAGKAQRRKQGRRADGRPPFGYRSARGVLEPIAELVPVVREMFAQARDGWSAGKIARELDTAGQPAPQGGAQGWSARAVLLVLRNVAYAGEAHGVKGAHPALVSRRLFNQVQARLDERARHGAGRRA